MYTHCGHGHCCHSCFYHSRTAHMDPFRNVHAYFLHLHSSLSISNQEKYFFSSFLKVMYYFLATSHLEYTHQHNHKHLKEGACEWAHLPGNFHLVNVNQSLRRKDYYYYCFQNKKSLYKKHTYMGTYESTSRLPINIHTSYILMYVLYKPGKFQITSS